MKFLSTKDTCSERSKADIKNQNYPILCEMYMGSADMDLKCIITGREAFASIKCPIRGNDFEVFQIEFDHIRKKQNTETTCPGHSIDKSRRSSGRLRSPSALFRENRLTDRYNAIILYEFMAMMPLSTSAHKALSSSSCYSDITLKDFDKCYGKSARPWVIRNAKNFNKFRKKYTQLGNINYSWFIEHLSNIKNDPISDRLHFNSK